MAPLRRTTPRFSIAQAARVSPPRHTSLEGRPLGALRVLGDERQSFLDLTGLTALRNDRLGQLDDAPCGLVLRLGPDQWLALVGALAKARIERNLGKQRSIDCL